MIQKKYLIMFLVFAITIAFAFNSCIYAWSSSEPWKDILGYTSDANVNGEVELATYKIWNTVKIVMQILAVVGIMFAGVSIMFSSAQQKADAKKKLGLVLFGSILVFATSIVIDIILQVARETLK